MSARLGVPPRTNTTSGRSPAQFNKPSLSMSRAKEQIQELREVVKKSDEERSRPCPECGMACFINYGRCSHMYFFKHERENDCIYNQIGTSLFFKTSADALKAEKMFWHQSDK